MKRITSLCAAASIVGMICATATAQAQQEQNPPADQADRATDNAQGPAATTQPTAFFLVVPVPVVPVVPGTVAVPRLAPDAEEIRDVVASATEAALTEDGFNDLLERLVDADRNRIGAASVEDQTAALDAAAERLRSAWQAKFGDEFDVENESLVYAPFPVIQGVIGSEAEVASDQTYAPNEPEDYNLEPGREIAVIGMPQTGNMPELAVPLIDEAGGWKIDVPNRIGGEELIRNLTTHLQMLASEVPHLAADEQQAYRETSHRVMMALLGAAPQEREQEQQQGQSQEQQP